MRKYRVVGPVASLLLLLALVVLSTRSAEEEAKLDGGIEDAPAGTENDLLVNDLARFTVEEHNNKANSLLQFEKLVKVRQQVVAGTMYYFTIEAKDGEARKLYEAKVWEKLWGNSKELLEFKPAEMVPALKFYLMRVMGCRIRSWYGYSC